MLERHIQLVRTDNPALESATETRTRLKDRFAPGAARRMTQLGMLVGSLINEIAPTVDDTVVYASQFGEGWTLETFLDSFPTASPTAFQTSIHPSGVQQALIARQQPIRELLPLAGGPQLVAHAILAALLAPPPRVLLCGGEERGGSLLDVGAASSRSFAFAALLTREPAAGAAGCVSLRASDDANGSLPLEAWFDLLHERRDFMGAVAPGLTLHLRWQ